MPGLARPGGPAFAAAPRCARPARAPAPDRSVPPLDACVEVAAGRLPRSASRGRSATSRSAASCIGRYPVVNAHVRAFAAATGRAPAARARLADPQLADHPATERHLAEAEAFCAWAGAPPSPTAATSGRRRRAGPTRAPWPWGDTFDPERCDCAEAGWGWTVPVTAHPRRREPVRRRAARRQRVGVGRRPHADGWRVVARRLVPRHTPGACAPRACLPADPARATPTTGFRIAVDPDPGGRRERGPRPDPTRSSTRCATSTTRAAPTAASASSTWASSRTSAWTAPHVDVDLVLTTGWCPFVSSMSTAIPERLRGWTASRPSRSARVWDPVWTMDRLSASAREKLEMPLEELEPYRSAGSPRREEPDHGHHRDPARRRIRARAQGQRVRLRLRLPHLQLRSQGERPRAARRACSTSTSTPSTSSSRARARRSSRARSSSRVERRRDLRDGHRGLRHGHDRGPAAAADRPLPRRPVGLGEVRGDGGGSIPTGRSSGAP